MIFKILDNCEVDALKNELEVTLPGTAKVLYIYTTMYIIDTGDRLV